VDGDQPQYWLCTKNSDNRSGKNGVRMTAETPLPRARYGMILPSSNRMAEIHANRFTPPGIAPYATRLRMTGSHFMPLDELLPKVAEASELLADAKCDPVVFHCTANSMASGMDGEKRITDAIAEATGVQATTTAAATMAALEALDARRIVLVSPYVRKTHEHELNFMAEAGIEVVGERNLGLNGSDAYCSTPPAKWIEVLRDLKNDRADAYFASCANITAIEAIDEMEEMLGKPVLTSNQVVIWQALRMAGIGDALLGLGRLGKI
jgi:maleate isomerase